MSLKKAIQDVILWRGLNFLSVFILNVLVARFFGASEAGNLFFFINNLSLAILITSFSLEAGLGYYAATGKTNSKRLGILALAWCVIASLACFLLSGVFKRFFYLDSINTGIASLLYISGSLLTSFFSALFFARQKYIAPNACLLGINIILVGLFISGMQGWVSSGWLLKAYFAGFLLQGAGIAAFYFFDKNEKVTAGPANDVLNKVIKYSATVFLSNLVFFLVYRIDYWFVEVYCSPGELGNYIQVSKIIQWLLLLPLMISSVLFPMTARGLDNSMMKKIIVLSRVLFWLYVCGSIFLALTGYWAFIWLFGNTYVYIYPLFLLHVPGLLALAALYPISSYHAGIKRVDINLQGSVLALLAIIILNLLLTPGYGIYGASTASSAGYLVYFIFSFLKFKRISKAGFFEIYKPMRSDYNFLKSILYRAKHV
jgi:O-antigen/teichoic acid export membrane protein